MVKHEKYNFEQLIRTAFNINKPFVYNAEPTTAAASAFVFDAAPNATAPAAFNLPLITDHYEAERMSALGTPIIFPIKFKGGNYNRYNGTGSIEQVQLDDLWLPPVTFVDFRRAKVITKTKPLGANGTVKEIFGIDDWVITVRGLALNEESQSAEQQVQKLERFEELVSSIEVEGKLFISKKIYSLVIDEMSVQQVQGKHGVFAFELRCLSDEAVELIL